MALSFDQVSNSTVGTNVTSVSWTHAGGTGADVAIVIGHIIDATDADRDITSATYGCAACISQNAQDNAAGNFGIEIFTKVTPATGSQTVVVNGTGGGGSADNLLGGAITLADSVGTPAVGVSGGSTGTSTAPAVSLTVSANAWMIGTITDGVADATSIAVNTGTERYEVDMGTRLASCATRGPLAAGSQTIDWTTNNAGFAVTAVEIEEATGEAAPPIRRYHIFHRAIFIPIIYSLWKFFLQL